MTGVREMRQRAKFALIILLVVDVAAAAVLLSPIGASGKAKADELKVVRQQWQDEMHKAIPVRDIDKKIVQANDEVSKFYRDRIPTRNSTIPIELGKLANENGVRLSNVHYTPDEQDFGSLRRLQIDLSLAGDYSKVMKFINGLERSKVFFIVDTVGLAEQQGGTVRLELKLETFLRDAMVGEKEVAAKDEAADGAKPAVEKSEKSTKATKQR